MERREHRLRNTARGLIFTLGLLFLAQPVMPTILIPRPVVSVVDPPGDCPEIPHPHKNDAAKRIVDSVDFPKAIADLQLKRYTFSTPHSTNVVYVDRALIKEGLRFRPGDAALTLTNLEDPRTIEIDYQNYFLGKVNVNIESVPQTP